MSGFSRLDPALVVAFRILPTSAISDALDRQGIEGAVEGLRPMLAGRRMAGQAVTLAYLPTGRRRGTMGDFLHLAQPGDVLALDMRGRTDCTAWGAILTDAAHRAGLSGTVIDGANRDIGESREVGYPIWSRAHFMRTGKDRWQLEAANVPIALGGIRVEAGDLLCADDAGVVVVPQEAVVSTLAIVREIGAKEVLIQDAVRAGTELAEARATHGYFDLQGREGR